MEMSGEHRIPAPRDKVWAALNDPEVLKQCIPGCENLDLNEAGDGFDATVKAKVGPVKATFGGSVQLQNVNAPESYTISGEGKGGAAGFAKGSADVQLKEDGGETVLTYQVKAQVGGKLAQIGSRLIDSTAKKYANDFFSKFAEIVGGGEAAPQPQPAEEPAPQPGAQPAAAAATSPPVDEAAEVDDGMKEAEPASAQPEPHKAAIDAVDQAGAKRKGGLSGMSWTLIVIVAVLILLGLFAGVGG